jgi:fatty-acyl-CoA synthase
MRAEVAMSDSSSRPLSVPSYSHGTSDLPLLGQAIGENLRRVASGFPDREVLVDVPSGRRWTYRRFDEAVSACARGLIDAGIGKGDRVGIWSPNNPEWVLLQYATAAIGAVLVNVNPAYRTHELSFALRQSGVRLLVSAVAYKTSDYRGMVEEVRGDLPALERVIYLGTDEWEALGTTGAALDPGLLAERMATLSPDDPINIQYTSGTTGFPKGATLSHHNILNNGFFIGELCRYSERQHRRPNQGHGDPGR